MESASGGDGAGLPKPTAATCNTITGLATGRFGARLKNGVVTSQGIVHGKSDLSAADKAALARLPADGRYFTMNLEFPPRGLPADGGPRPRRRRAHHGLPLAEMDLTLHRVELAELIAFLAVLLLAGFAGTGFVRRSLRPLRQVAATATRVTELPLASGSVTLTERVPNANPRTGVCQSNPRSTGYCSTSRRACQACCERGTAAPARRGRESRAAHPAVSHPGATRSLAAATRAPVPAEIKRALNRVESELPG